MAVPAAGTAPRRVRRECRRPFASRSNLQLSALPGLVHAQREDLAGVDDGGGNLFHGRAVAHRLFAGAVLGLGGVGWELLCVLMRRLLAAVSRRTPSSLASTLRRRRASERLSLCASRATTSADSSPNERTGEGSTALAPISSTASTMVGFS